MLIVRLCDSCVLLSVSRSVSDSAECPDPISHHITHPNTTPLSVHTTIFTVIRRLNPCSSVLITLTFPYIPDLMPSQSGCGHLPSKVQPIHVLCSTRNLSYKLLIWHLCPRRDSELHVVCNVNFFSDNRVLPSTQDAPSLQVRYATPKPFGTT